MIQAHLYELFPELYPNDNHDTYMSDDLGTFHGDITTVAPSPEANVNNITPRYDFFHGATTGGMPLQDATQPANTTYHADHDTTDTAQATQATNTTPANNVVIRTRVTPAAILPASTPASTTPKANPKSKGRSGGDKSSKGIKRLRILAENGDLEAAKKLGWGVERITKIFNEHKRARGIHVALDAPIDDPDLIAYINEKHKYQAEVQKKRQEKLRLAAYQGDMEAARKLKLGKRTMEAIFGGNQEPDVIKKETKVIKKEKKTKKTSADGKGQPGGEVEKQEAGREKTPAEPFNFEQERLQENPEPLNSRTSPPAYGMGGNLLPPFPYPTPAESQDHPASPWAAAPEPNTWYMLGQAPQLTVETPQMLFDPERALIREYDAAVEQFSFAEANLNRIEQQLEQFRAEKAEKERAAKSKAATATCRVTKQRKKPAKKDDDSPYQPTTRTRKSKAHMTNFPVEDGEGDGYGDQGFEMPTRGSSMEVY